MFYLVLFVIYLFGDMWFFEVVVGLVVCFSGIEMVKCCFDILVMG